MSEIMFVPKIHSKPLLILFLNSGSNIIMFVPKIHSKTLLILYLYSGSNIPFLHNRHDQSVTV